MVALHHLTRNLPYHKSAIENLKSKKDTPAWTGIGGKPAQAVGASFWIGCLVTLCAELARMCVKHPVLFALSAQRVSPMLAQGNALGLAIVFA